MRLDPLTPKIWRHGIAFVIAFDAVQLAVRTHLRAPLAASLLPVHHVFIDIALSTWRLGALAAVSAVASAFFARGRAQVLAGVVALGANRVLLEAFGAVDGIYDETSYHAGAALLGWLCGRMFARALGEGRGTISAPPGDANGGDANGARGTEDRGREADVLAALGAAAMFGATYLNAGTSKLREGGLSWADSDTIRLLILSHRPVGVATWFDPFRTFVADSPSFAMFLAVGTLIIQCGAFTFPWTARTRAVWGTLFLSFHVGIHLVSGSIFFLQTVFLTLLFAVPWSRLLVRARLFPAPPEVVEAPAPPEQLRRVIAVAATVLVALAALAIAPVRPRAHPIEVQSQAAAGSAGAPALPRYAISPSRLGPLATGAEIGGWTIRALLIEDDKLAVTLARSGQEIVFDVTRNPIERGPFDVDGLHIFYRETSLPFTDFRPAGDGLARTLADAPRTGDLPSAFEGWLREAQGR